MSIFIQEVLGLLKRNQKKVTLDKTKDWFEFGKLYQSSVLNTGASYNPKMDPFVIKWGDLVCQATEDLTRTLPGEGNLGFIPVYTDPSGFCSWDTLKDSIITQNILNTIITIGGNLVVTGDVAINGCDLTSSCTTFNLLNTGPVSFINFGGASSIIQMSNAGGIVNVNGTTQSTSCTTGALVVKGGVGIAKDLFVCGNATISGDAAINGGDLTSTATTFNLLNSVTNINFGNASQNILIGGLNATSTVAIVGTKNSTSCTTGALTVAGGVGILKDVYICGELSVASATFLNENVTLGGNISDHINLVGQLYDNNGNAALINQALVGIGGGAATWQNIALVGEVCAINSIPLWTPNSSTLGCSLIYQNGNSSTPATKIFIKGGLASEGSQVTTIYDTALGYGNYVGAENGAAFNFRTSALGYDAFAAGHRAIAGGHASFAAGYNSGAGNYAFGIFVSTAVSSTTLSINVLNGTVSAGDYIRANNELDPTTRYEILTVTPVGGTQFTITVASAMTIDASQAFSIEQATPNPNQSTGAIALGYNAASKGNGAIAIGSLASTEIPNQIAIGSGYSTVKLGGTAQDNTQNKILVLDANEVVRWRDASTITPVTANNGLTMSTTTNVQLGGTLLQNTTINNANFDFVVSRTNAGDAIFGLNSSSGGGVTGRSTSGYGVAGASVSGVGVSGASESFRAGQFSISPVSDNTVVENTIFQRNVYGSAPANDGIGQSLVFENAIKNGNLASANSLISKFTSTGVSARTSEFSITGVNAGVTGNKLILSGDGSLRLPDYGAGGKTGTATYGLSVTSTGNVIETIVPYTPKLFTALLSQSGTGVAPTMIVLYDFSAGAVTFTWSYVSIGLYELTASQPIFLGPKTAFYIIPDVNPGKAYCAAIERVSDTVLRVNSYDMTGASDNSCFDRATFKFEIYQ